MAPLVTYYSYSQLIGSRVSLQHRKMNLFTRLVVLSVIAVNATVSSIKEQLLLDEVAIMKDMAVLHTVTLQALNAFAIPAGERELISRQQPVYLDLVRAMVRFKVTVEVMADLGGAEDDDMFHATTQELIETALGLDNVANDLVNSLSRLNSSMSAEPVTDVLIADFKRELADANTNWKRMAVRARVVKARVMQNLVALQQLHRMEEGVAEYQHYLENAVMTEHAGVFTAEPSEPVDTVPSTEDPIVAIEKRRNRKKRSNKKRSQLEETGSQDTDDWFLVPTEPVTTSDQEDSIVVVPAEEPGSASAEAATTEPDFASTATTDPETTSPPLETTTQEPQVTTTAAAAARAPKTKKPKRVRLTGVHLSLPTGTAAASAVLEETITTEAPHVNEEAVTQSASAQSAETVKASTEPSLVNEPVGDFPQRFPVIPANSPLLHAPEYFQHPMPMGLQPLPFVQVPGVPFVPPPAEASLARLCSLSTGLGASLAEMGLLCDFAALASNDPALITSLSALRGMINGMHFTGAVVNQASQALAESARHPHA